MKTGKTLIELATEIERQHEAKVDILAPSKALVISTQPSDGELLDAAIAKRASAPTVSLRAGAHSFSIGEVAHEQLAELSGIPRVYYDRVLAQAPGLYAQNVNHWLEARPASERRLVRTLDGRARAVLSDRYRSLDHFDTLAAILPVLNEQGLALASSEVTERRLYLQVVSPKLSGEVKKGDVVNFGLVVSNSEVGCGALKVEKLVYRLACLNGAIFGSAIKRAHVGGRNGDASDGIEEYLKDSTRSLRDAAFFATVKDTVAGVLSEGGFASVLAGLREAAGEKIQADPAKLVEVVRREHGLTERERGGLLRNLIEGADLSRWGLANAVTALAHEAVQYDRSIELERAGAQVIELPKADWKRWHDLAESAKLAA